MPLTDANNRNISESAPHVYFHAVQLCGPTSHSGGSPAFLTLLSKTLHFVLKGDRSLTALQVSSAERNLYI